MTLKSILGLMKTTLSEWSDDGAPRLAAALAYYTVFSVAPLLMIAITVAGLAFGEEAARGQIVNQIAGLVGRQGAEAIQEMIQNARRPAAGTLAGVIGIITLLVGASGVMYELQTAMNTIWDVERKPAGVLALVKDRLLSFTMVLGVGFMLLVSLVLSAALSALGGRLSALAPSMEALLQTANFLISVVVITVLFAMIFKYVPEVEVRWRDVWLGATVTALLFTVGKQAIGFYLGRSSFASAYGAAGSLVVLLAWVYYSAQILFLGAEFTQVYANRHGQGALPVAAAKSVGPASQTAAATRAVRDTGYPAAAARRLGAEWAASSGTISAPKTRTRLDT